LQLHDLRDAEALAWKTVYRAGGKYWPREDQEDAVAFLLATAWQLSLTYDEKRDRAVEKGRRPTFSDYCAEILRRRLVDFTRKTLGDPGSDPGPLSFRSTGSSTTPQPGDIDWTILSPIGKATLLGIAVPLSRGATVTEIGRETGLSTNFIQKQMQSLRAEIQNGVQKSTDERPKSA